MAIRPTKQELHSEEMRNKILAIANQMFREYGFDKVSVRDIAAQAGVTTGSLYHHFKSKQDLFFAIGFQKAESMETLMEQYSQSQRPLEDLEEFLCETMTQRVLDDGFEFTQYRVLRSMNIGGKKGRLERCVEVLLQRAVEQGLLPEDCDIEPAAEHLLWLYRGVVYHYCVAERPVELKEEMHRSFRLTLAGLKHTPGAFAPPDKNRKTE